MNNSDNHVEVKIKGTFFSKVIEELLVNSLHFPMVNLILEALEEGISKYFQEPDAYLLFLCAILQAVGLTYIRQKKPKLLFLGHLIGPSIYVLVEAPLEGSGFFFAPQHVAYWVFSILIACTSTLSYFNKAKIKEFFVLIENLIRTLIPLAMYAIFEAHGKDFILMVPIFFSDIAHVFLSIVLVLLGGLIGFANIQNERSKMRVSELARQLKNYSSWSLGEHVLNKAINDESIFKIKRVERSIFFIDIRGFTKWSEQQSPEKVVEMLNQYYSISEEVLKSYSVLKMKYTADEIMVVFDDIHQAIEASLLLKNTLNTFLDSYQLNAGGGLHAGAVVEGLIGSEHHRIFDIMGDTVNTAKRYCESAKGSELLISDHVIELSEGRAYCTEEREIAMKGKEKKQKAYPLLRYF